MRWAVLLGCFLSLLLEASPAEEPAYPVLVVVPLGKPAPDLVDFVAESLRSRFLLEIKVTEPVELPQAAWYQPRKRWRAEKILEYLRTLDLGNAWRICGITEEPISTNKGKIYDWGIAGLADMGGTCSVLTSYLFRKLKKHDRKSYLRYMENLVLHEVGHTLGLEHCPLERCIMADAKGNALRAARKSINEFCPRCTNLIKERLRDPTIKGKWTAAEWAILRRLSP